MHKLMKSIGILKTVYNQSGLVDRISRNINDYGSSQIRTFIQDDCSPDNTYEKYLAASPAFTSIWQTADNLGARGNIASLLQKCDTDYVNFAAGDDFISTPTIRFLLEFVQKNDPDIIIVKGIHVPDDHAYELTLHANLSKHFNPEVCKNAQIFSTNFNNHIKVMAAAATYPGFIWSQGLLVKTDLAKRAGFLKSGDVDDWGFQHNLAVISLSEKLRITLVDRILGIMTYQLNSLGSNAIQQLESQINVIHLYWHPLFKKAALLNCLKKKLDQFYGDAYSYDETWEALCSAFKHR